MSCLTVYMLTVAFETWLFTEPHQLHQSQRWIIPVANQPASLQAQHSCSKPAQANRDHDPSSGRMHSVRNNRAVPASLELKLRLSATMIFGER